MNYLLNAYLIKKYLQLINPDILHAHYVSSYGVTGFLTGFHPYVISVWGKDIYDAPKNLILKFLIKKALRNADYILSTSRTMVKQTKKFVTNKKIVVTPFGIDLTKFYPRNKKNSGRFIIGTARGLMPKYGIKYLVEAFAMFTKAVQNAELHIAGDGPQKDELISFTHELKIADVTKFWGFIVPGRIPEFLSNLDVFCMPSIDDSESFGVAALEAQACGIPVIASNVGGLPETIVDFKTGFLVPPRNPTAIAEKILFLYKNPEIRFHMGIESFNFVKTYYNWADNIKIIEQSYESLMCQNLQGM